MKNIYIVGSKGIPGNYGGYETFVDKLTEYHQNDTDTKYHVACKDDVSGEFEYHNARCFKIKVPNIGPAQAIYYDVMALNACCKHIKEHRIEKPVVYVLACRIGPFANHFHKRINNLGGLLFVNPDGHEWLRAKWSAPVRKYWKLSESLMVKHSDLMVCDSKNIEKYIIESYRNYKPKTTYIAYGAETRKSTIDSDDKILLDWYKENGLSKNSYYLVVGRFVPENNYETMIREFMISNTHRNFVLITNVSEKFFDNLKNKTGFEKDKRIKFVGTVYDQELLMKIRENAYGNFHGHEVGGTNPSLLEALSTTKLNLLLDVGFNREVADGAALYWSKEYGSLASVIEKADKLPKDEIDLIEAAAKNRIADHYSWKFISNEYRNLFNAYTQTLRGSL